MLAAFYNVFITGIFYTGFLTMYDMSITDAGIITFVPYIANMFSIFSNKILGHFPRPKKILLLSKIIFYSLFILATTAMPMFVTDPDARLAWFVIITFCAYAFFSPFSPGFTTWFYNFYPEDNSRRARYILLLQVFSSITSSLILLFSGFLTDLLNNSPYQNQLILGFRYFAFILVLLEIFMQSRAKEYPSADNPGLKLHKVFTLPFHYPKFLACMILMFVWNFIANLNNGLWNYHLLNHLNFSYTLINTVSVLYTLVLITLSPVWQKVLRRYSWIKTFGIALLFWVPTEIAMGCITLQSTHLWIPMAICQHILSVGLNISYANILYMNLPTEDSGAHIVFNTIGCNICAFLGLLAGTWISSFSGDETINLIGMDIYSVQFTCHLRALLILLLGIILVVKWKMFTKDIDIAEIEQMKYVRQKFRQQRRGVLRG